MRRGIDAALNALILITAVVALAVTLGRLFNYPVLLVSVSGASMAPSIRPGSAVPVLPIRLVGDPRAGDVVVYRGPERQWIIHRVVGGDRFRGWTTQGDANRNPDAVPVKPDQIVGIVPAFAGRFLQFPVPAPSGPEPVLNAVVALVLLGAGLLVFFAGRDGRPARRLRRGRRRASRDGAVSVTYLIPAATAAGAVLLISAALQPSRMAPDTALEQRPGRLTERPPAPSPCGGGQAVKVENRSPIPLVITVTCRGAPVDYDPPAALIWPGRVRTFNTAGPGAQGGSGELRGSVHPPFLPPGLLWRLERMHPFLASAALASVPASVILLAALLDVRFRRDVRRRWRRLRVGLSLRPVRRGQEGGL